MALGQRARCHRDTVQIERVQARDPLIADRIPPIFTYRRSNKRDRQDTRDIDTVGWKLILAGTDLGIDNLGR